MASILDRSVRVQRSAIPEFAPGSLRRLRRLACMALLATVMLVTTISLNTSFASTDNWAGTTPITHAHIADANCGGIVAGCH